MFGVWLGAGTGSGGKLLAWQHQKRKKNLPCNVSKSVRFINKGCKIETSVASGDVGRCIFVFLLGGAALAVSPRFQSLC